jgi:tRNA pseudouridine32 synthase/23S rRNA pseudouridine746 synthase
MFEGRILFLDGEAIVLDKPAGLPVTRARAGGPSLEDALEGLRFGFQRAPAAVHRLDRDTSGCLLLARNPKAHRRFAAAFEAGAVAKTYLAVLEGVPAVPGGTIDLALGKISSREAGWRIVPDARGKAAVTDWEVIGIEAARALVAFRPRTGRTHQIRVHAASGLGHAIAGDPVYGRSQGPMLLHAWKLALPRAGKPPVEATAPLPPAFGGFVALAPADAG